MDHVKKRFGRGVKLATESWEPQRMARGAINKAIGP
jgi:hypothetical protein